MLRNALHESWSILVSLCLQVGSASRFFSCLSRANLTARRGHALPDSSALQHEATVERSYIILSCSDRASVVSHSLPPALLLLHHLPMDTLRSPSLQSFDGVSLPGSDISALPSNSPGTPQPTFEFPSAGALAGDGQTFGASVKHSRFFFPDGSLTLEVSQSFLRYI